MLNRISSSIDRHWWTVFGALIALIVTVMALVPLLMLVLSAISETGLPIDVVLTSGHFSEVFLNSSAYVILGNSFIFSGGSTAVAAFFAIPLSWFIERTDIRRKTFLRLLVLSGIGMPAVLTALGWSLLAAPRVGAISGMIPGFPETNVYSLGGMIFVQGITFIPVFFLMISPAMRNMDSSYEEAAMMSGATLMYTTRRITLGLLRPSLLAAMLYIFIAGLLVFDVPAVLGTPARISVLSSEIFAATSNYSVPRYGYASALSLFVALVGVVLATAYIWSTRQETRYATVSGRSRVGTISAGKLKWPCLALLATYLILGIGLPLTAIALTSFQAFFSKLTWNTLHNLTLDNYVTIFASSRNIDSFLNSLRLAFLAATIGTILAALVSWFVIRSKVRWRSGINLLAFLPLLMPGVSIGLAVRAGFLSVPSIHLYGTVWMLVAAYLIEILPFATRNINSSLLQLHGELEEAALMSRASYLRVFLRILLPLILPSVAFVWLWSFLRSMREFSTAAVLVTPGNEVASTLLYNYFSRADFTVAAAVGVLFFMLVFPITVIVLAWLEWTRGKIGMV